jgi:6-phosphogluconolactonase (cycloisomerase 2 family)
MSELSGKVTIFSYSDGRLQEIQSVVSDSLNGRGGADIHLSPDGKFLYSSNRLISDGISIFRVDAENGKLTKIGYQLTGIHPRNFNITPNGRFLLVACRDSNKIQVFERDLSTGLLKERIRTSSSIDLCIQFAQ